MTWLEIIDTTIKIGLGAFIGGMSTYLLNKQTYAYGIKKELLVDNRQTLKDVSTKFENIHANVISLLLEIVREYNSYLPEAEKYIEKIKSSRSKKIVMPN